MRTAARIDANQPEIVDGLRAVGATVQTLHMVGKGCPDLLVGFRGRNYLIECKDGSLPPYRRYLTIPEDDWHRKWVGQVEVAEDLTDALRIIGVEV